RPWQFRVDLRHKLFEIGKDLFGSFPGVEIIAAGAEEHHAWFVRQNDPLGEVSGVHDLRSAEPPIDYSMAGKILRERLPKTDRGRTDEEQRAGRGRVGAVHLFVRRDLLLPLSKVVTAFGA